MKQLSFLLFSIILMIGCTERDDEHSGVHIRIKNESSVHFDEVVVGGNDKIHENIPAGTFSKYLEYNTAYRYAYINILVGDENYILQPIDFVGETPLTNGFYTYGLSITKEGRVLLNFVVD
ncbi:MAG: hypothetical protein R3299_12120 [Arenibacter sp.]|nr:hypothetical protein [Arenibacter sp.]